MLAVNHVNQCQMTGEEVNNIVKSHGEDKFIHVSDIEQIASRHDLMAEKLVNHRAYFEGIIEHAPEDTPVEVLDMYRGFVEQIDEVLNHG